MKKKLIIIIFASIMFMQAQAQLKSEAKSSSSNLVKHVIKNTFPHDYYKMDRIPVESGLYLQRIIVSYNAHMKHAIMAWLNKESTHKVAYAKELSYLLTQLDSITTARQGIIMLARAISAYQDMRQHIAEYQEKNAWQERAYIMILLQCSVILVNVARQQLLMILDEVHSSLVYWRDQKQSPTKYFFQKSPLKWVSGKRQADEIAGNIRILEKLEHDVRVVLGRLTKHIYDFDLTGDNQVSYAWVNTLLSILAGIGKEKNEVQDSNRFEKTAENLRFKLSKVQSFKDTVLSKISSARKPGHVARNWLLYAAAALSAYQARNFYIQESDFIHESLSRAGEKVVQTWDLAIDPLKGAWKTIFAPSSAVTPEGENLLIKHAEEIKKVLPGLQAKKEDLTKLIGESESSTKETAIKQLEHLLATGKHTYFGWKSEVASSMLNDVKAGNLDSLRNAASDSSWLMSTTLKAELKEILLRLESADYVKLVGGIVSDAAIIIPAIAGATETTIGILGKFTESNALNMKLLTLIPAFGIALGANKTYHWMVQRDLSSVRLALFDINSLFIESEAPLSDHDYGKLIYLLQKLKMQALRYLKATDMRDDFLHDLAKLESNKFDVKQKRGIIKNMFMKYPFLGLNIKSA